MDVSCPVVFHMGQHPMHPFGRLGYGGRQVPQTRGHGTAVVVTHPAKSCPARDMLSPAQKWSLLPGKRY